MAYGARLESALGAIPRGFKSRILRGFATCFERGVGVMRCGLQLGGGGGI